VNPLTKRLADSNEIGEIWVAGSLGISSFAPFDKKANLTSELFAAVTPDIPDVAFTRTGTMGFLVSTKTNNQGMSESSGKCLFLVSGKSSEIIKINGFR
jgi:hypothetical protein